MMYPSRNPAPTRALLSDALRLRAAALATTVALLSTIARAADGIFDLGTLGGAYSFATAVSADGSVVVGDSYTANNAARHAFRWTTSGGMADLGTLGGRFSEARAVSADGSVVVGNSDTANNAASHAFRWTTSGGMADLGTLGGAYSFASAVSADGSVVVGDSYTANNAAPHAFRWTTSGGMADLGTLGGAHSFASAVSADGSVVVGSSSTANNPAIHAYRWTTSGGIADLGTLGGGFSEARAVSAEGSVVVGSSTTTNNAAFHAFRWTTSGGMADLGTLGGAHSFASGVSADGSVVVGSSTTANNAASHAYRWTTSGGMADLGTLGGADSHAYDVSADGKVVVGGSRTANNAATRAFRWTQATGMQSVEQWLAANGVTVAPSLATEQANGTNSNGNVVVGQLESGRPFYARVGPLGSGLIDVADFRRTLQGVSYIAVQTTSQANLVVEGLNGSPLRGLPAAGRHSAWVSGDWGRQKNVPGDGDVGAGEVGLAYGLSEPVKVKLAVGRTYGAQELAYGGSAKVMGTYVLPEIVAALPRTPLYLTVSGYYNAGDADIKRGYLNAGSPVTSDGSPDTSTTGARLRLDWLNALETGDLRLTPYVSISGYRGHVSAYTETGGGFPVKWDARTERTSLRRIGADATYLLAEGWNLLAKIEGVRRFDAQSSGATGTILGLGNFSTDEVDYRQNWLRANIGAEGKIGPGVAAVILNASTETNGATYWAYASYRYDF